MNIVLSGASGFIGSVLAPHLEPEGQQVTRLVRRRPRPEQRRRMIDLLGASWRGIPAPWAAAKSSRAYPTNHSLSDAPSRNSRCMPGWRSLGFPLKFLTMNHRGFC